MQITYGVTSVENGSGSLLFWKIIFLIFVRFSRTTFQSVTPLPSPSSFSCTVKQSRYSPLRIECCRRTAVKRIGRATQIPRYFSFSPEVRVVWETSAWLCKSTCILFISQLLFTHLHVFRLIHLNIYRISSEFISEFETEAMRNFKLWSWLNLSLKCRELTKTELNVKDCSFCPTEFNTNRLGSFCTVSLVYVFIRFSMLSYYASQIFLPWYETQIATSAGQYLCPYLRHTTARGTLEYAGIKPRVDSSIIFFTFYFIKFP